MSTIIALLVLSLLIFFHELGHFLAARALNVKVEVFSIGFGKKLISKQFGNTLWTISAIPLGGYVQMKGQDDTNPNKISTDTDSYSSKKPWQRIIILLSGPFANFLVAFLLYIAIALIGVPKLLPTVGTISPNSPAQGIGLKQGDIITHINNQRIIYWEQISKQTLNSQDVIELVYTRDSQTYNKTLMPKLIEDKNMFGETIQRAIIGISPNGDQVTAKYNFTQTITFAYNELIKSSSMIITSVEKLITGVVGTDQLGGVISIVDVTAKASTVSIVSLFFFTALISVNLGVLNLLPIPALDGGHIMFNIYEQITKRTPSEKVMMHITITGWAFLISLMALGLYNDINRIWGS